MHRYFLLIVFLFALMAGSGCSRTSPAPEKTNTKSEIERNVSEDSKAASETEAATESDAEKENDSENQESAEAEEGEEDEFDEFEEEFGEAEAEVFDPFSGYNRIMTSFNDVLYTWVFFPVVRGYRYVVPGSVRKGIGSFFKNLLYPIRMVNNLLQLKFKNAGEETLRFVTNTTIGVLGFWDPAKEWFDLEAHDEDFGQTLGYYGVPAGPHIVLPFLGPSNLRDSLSLYPDFFVDPQGFADPIGLTETWEAEYMVKAFQRVNDPPVTEDAYNSFKRDAVDFYPFMRDFYEQMRKRKIEE